MVDKYCLINHLFCNILGCCWKPRKFYNPKGLGQVCRRTWHIYWSQVALQCQKPIQGEDKTSLLKIDYEWTWWAKWNSKENRNDFVADASWQGFERWDQTAIFVKVLTLILFFNLFVIGIVLIFLLNFSSICSYNLRNGQHRHC